MLRAVAVLALVWAAVASRPPSPTPTKTSQQAEQGANQGGTNPGGGSNGASPFLGSHAAGSQTTCPCAKGNRDDNGPSAQWWFNFLLVIFTGALAVVGVLQLLTFRWQAKVMHRQTAVMRRQLGSMRTTGDDTHDLAIAAATSARATEALVNSAQRAWISVEVRVIEDVEFRDGALRVVVQCIVKNVGRTVANEVQLRCKMLFATYYDEYDWAFQVQSGLASEPPQGTLGKTVFPNETDRFYECLVGSKADVEAGILPNNVISPLVVGCVVYRYPNSPTHHVTRFCYVLHHKTAGVWTPNMEVGRPLRRDSDEVGFTKFFYGGSTAD